MRNQLPQRITRRHSFLRVAHRGHIGKHRAAKVAQRAQRRIGRAHAGDDELDAVLDQAVDFSGQVVAAHDQVHGHMPPRSWSAG